MEITKTNLTKRALDSIEKAAYVAVGAPTTGLKALSARVIGFRDAVRSSGRKLSEDVATEMDEWIDQGEEVIDRAMQRFRDSDVAHEIKTQVASTRKAARIGVDKASGAARTGLALLDPDEELTAITGIGPSNEAKLQQVGISGISRFLERTDSRDDIAELASSSGVGEETLMTWREQVDLSRIDGIGDSYQLLLHRLGVWTMSHLAEADKSELLERMRAVDLPDAPDQLPSESEIAGWQRAAKKLAPAT